MHRLARTALSAMVWIGWNAPTQVTVIGDDYAFVKFPATIPAGLTAFSFENRGKHKHEMSMVLLTPGTTLQDVVQRGPGAASSRAMAQSLIGLLIARQGETGGGQLLVDLKSGQR